jgi:hypothetical protein
VILIKGLIHFLVSNSIISKETIRILIGWFLFIPIVIVPTIVVGAVLFGLRKMTARAVCIMNLMMASGALLIFIMGESGCHSALSMSPPRPHPPMTVRELAMDSMVLFWFAGAVGLFFRKRLAWVGSVIGAGVSASFVTACLVGIIVAYLYPDADMNRLKEIGAAGYIFALVAGLTQFFLLLALSLHLLIGLLRMRKELFAAS